MYAFVDIDAYPTSYTFQAITDDHKIHISNEVRYAMEEFKDDENAYTNAEAFAELYGANSLAYDPDELTDVGKNVWPES